jgi:hypothetical protein
MVLVFYIYLMVQGYNCLSLILLVSNGMLDSETPPTHAWRPNFCIIALCLKNHV